MKGGQLIAKGTYGCVFRPQLLCKGDTVRGDGVSKLIERKNAIEEVKEQTIVDSIDPEFKFHLKPPKMCDIGDLDTTEDSLDRCGMVSHLSLEGLKEKYVILQMTDGGVSLGKHVNTLGSSKDLLLFPQLRMGHLEDLFLKMRNLFVGLVEFEKNEFIHLDIKPDNIVYNEEEGRFNFIDFGLSHSSKNIWKLIDERNFIFRSGYFVVPLETSLIFKNYDNAREIRDIFSEKARFLFFARKLRYSKRSSYKYMDMLTSEDIYLKLLIEHVDSYNDILQKYTDSELLKRLAQNIDTYSMGIVLIDLFTGLYGKKYQFQRKRPFTHEILKEISEFIDLLIHPDLSVRLTPTKALEYYDNIVFRLSGNQPPLNSGAAAAASGYGEYTNTGVIDIIKTTPTGSAAAADIEIFMDPLEEKIKSIIKEKLNKPVFKKLADIKTFIKTGSIEDLTGEKFSFIHALAYYARDYIKYFKYLMKLPGLDVNLEASKFTPLIIAAYNSGSKSSEEAVKLLLDHPEIDVNKRGQYNRSALFYAVQEAKLTSTENTVRLILDHMDTEIDIKDDDNDTPIIVAVSMAYECSSIRVVNMLLNVPDIDINNKGKLGKTALIYGITTKNSMSNTNYELVKMILEIPETTVDINIKDDSGKQAIDYALEMDDTKVIQLLNSYNQSGGRRKLRKNKRRKTIKNMKSKIKKGKRKSIRRKSKK